MFLGWALLCLHEADYKASGHRTGCDKFTLFMSLWQLIRAAAVVSLRWLEFLSYFIYHVSPVCPLIWRGFFFLRIRDVDSGVLLVNLNMPKKTDQGHVLWWNLRHRFWTFYSTVQGTQLSLHMCSVFARLAQLQKFWCQTNNFLLTCKVLTFPHILNQRRRFSLTQVSLDRLLAGRLRNVKRAGRRRPLKFCLGPDEATDPGSFNLKDVMISSGACSAHLKLK